MSITNTFRRTVLSATKGEVVIPALTAFLWDPKFPSFTIKVRKHYDRKPDGLFHPSEHPLMGARQLYYYLTAPKSMIAEPFDPNSVMSVTQGAFWHGFVQTCGLKQKILKGVEVPVSDPATGAAGSMDGLLNAEVLNIPEDEPFEFKTMHEAKVSRIPEAPPESGAVLEWLMERHLDYWAQHQEYLRMSGYPRGRMLLLSLAYPFPMREIVIPRDEEFHWAVKEKYLAVRRAAEQGVPPEYCCSLGSAIAKSCPARTVCPIGLGAPQ